jgi:hypothetical protein
MRTACGWASKLFNNMTITHPKSAVPVMRTQSSKFTVFMPTGRFICPISPARKGEWKKKEDENEERRRVRLN